MLSEIIEKRHFAFVDSCDSWQEAIRRSCDSLVSDGTVTDTYADEIIRCINEYGPYIVIMPMVALPHTQENAEGVKKTAIAFMKLKQPTEFDPEDREKDAQIFFTIASENHEQHLSNISRLADMLCMEGFVEALLEAEKEEDLRRIASEFDL